jgi:energy-coupling factor transport system ATP-binding protein
MDGGLMEPQPEHDGAVIVAARDAAFRFALAGPNAADVLTGVNLTVHAGEFVGVIGANGAGKTTLTRLLTGELVPTSGAITYGVGVDPWRDIALVSADPLTQLLTTSVFDEVAFSLRARREERETVIAGARAALAAFGLEGWETRRPADLSVGEQLRMLAAAAVARRPRLLILDEVSSMIDGRNWTAIRQVARAGQARGEYGLLLVTHRLEDLVGASRALLLSGGVVVAEGPVGDLYERALAHPEWRVDVPPAYATWRALDPAGQARYAALWPAGSPSGGDSADPMNPVKERPFA